MRKVKYSRNEYNSQTQIHEPVEIGEGYLLEYGVDYEELGSETGTGAFSTAIIELPDGTVKNIPVEFIRFIEPYGRTKA